ncbi:MAG: HAD family hydrolase [Calditrichia bacterium]
MFLDILPYRASKGKAIRYLSYKWNIPLNHILVAGDSDNDEDMLRGEMLGIVVGNHHPDLDKLRGLKNIYFAKNAFAAGILEGFNHYGFPKRKIRETEEEYANINE